MKIEFIVLTGGPGAGKTAVIEFLRKMVCPHVALLPESASILFSGGFWRLDSDSATKATQRAIYRVQDEMQNLATGEHRWAVAICDRGTLDGAAYWPGNIKDFFKDLGTDREKEYRKYKAIIHMQSPTLEKGYNHQNPYRIESAELALKIDRKIHEVWKDHPGYSLIESTDGFLEKVNTAVLKIESFLPECCKYRPGEK